MPYNQLGRFVRERRMSLGLTQQQLAERIAVQTTQADISRLERGYVELPRRSRLEALATALEVTPGILLMRSGWLAGGESTEADRLLSLQQRSDEGSSDAMLNELVHLRELLLSAIDRVEMLESNLQDKTLTSDEWEEVVALRGR